MTRMSCTPHRRPLREEFIWPSWSHSGFAVQGGLYITLRTQRAQSQTSRATVQYLHQANGHTELYSGQGDPLSKWYSRI